MTFAQIVHFINRVPNNTLPSYIKADENDFHTFTYWWRQIWHFLGGVGLTLPLYWFAKYPMTLPLATLIGIGLKEYFDDMEGSFDKFHWKSVIDTLMWTLGSFATCYLLGYML